MPLTKIQEAILERRKQLGPIVPREQQNPAKHRPVNPKWNDDAWFEKQYGDPDYYNR